MRAVVADGARLLLIPAFGERGKRQNQSVLARGRENGIPIVEANVGMNLIVNQGEIAAYGWGNNRITPRPRWTCPGQFHLKQPADWKQSIWLGRQTRWPAGMRKQWRK